MLTQKIANEIVKETSLRLDRNVNIMDTEGTIIATMNKARIGSIHKGAIEVLSTQKTLVIHPDQKWEGAQPGINLPIVFMDKIIGVIGITGDPKDLGNIGDLVKMTTELMIRQEFMDSQTEWKQRTKEVIIDQLMKKEPSMAIMEQNLKLLGLKLSSPFTLILVQLTEWPLPNRQLIELIEEKIGKNFGLVGFITVNRLLIKLTGIPEREIAETIQTIYLFFKELNLDFQMSHSLVFGHLSQFSQAYEECEIALEINESGTELTSFAQIEAKSLIYQVEPTVAERFTNRVLKNLDANQVKTLESFFMNDLNIQKTADDLYLHRNTLIYRLNKIIEETGYDPKHFKEALTLQVAVWFYRKAEKNKKI
jgi:carbohydrate diacid regulator